MLYKSNLLFLYFSHWVVKATFVSAKLKQCRSSFLNKDISSKDSCFILSHVYIYMRRWQGSLFFIGDFKWNLNNLRFGWVLKLGHSVNRDTTWFVMTSWSAPFRRKVILFNFLFSGGEKATTGSLMSALNKDTKQWAIPFPHPRAYR